MSNGIQLFVEQPSWVDPWQAIVLEADLVVRGWAFCDAGLDRLEVMFDGAPIAIRATGIAREDVMAALGGRESALRSGFEAQMPLDQITPGKHLVEVHAVSGPSARRVTFFVEPRANLRKGRPLKPLRRVAKAKKRAVFIDAATPMPDQDAGSNVALAHMAILQSLGYQVTFVPESLLPAGTDTLRLQRLGIETIYQPHHRTLDEFLRTRGGEFDLAYVHRYVVGEVAIPLLRAHAPQAKIIFNNADLHYLRLEREAKVLRDRSLAKLARAVKKRELAVIRSADCTLLCNSYELKLLRKEVPRAKLHYLPWVIEATRRAPKDFSKRHGIMFLGGFGHRPNVDAVKWFVARVMPLLRKKLPGVKFHVYGSGVTPAIRALHAHDVLIEGFAPSLDAIFKRHRLSVAPLRFGAGFKGKIADSWARGVPVVATSVALEGIGIRKSQIDIADTASTLAAAIVRLYEDSTVWKDRARNGIRLISDHYSVRCGRTRLQKILESVYPVRYPLPN